MRDQYKHLIKKYPELESVKLCFSDKLYCFGTYGDKVITLKSDEVTGINLLWLLHEVGHYFQDKLIAIDCQRYWEDTTYRRDIEIEADEWGLNNHNIFDQIKQNDVKEWLFLRRVFYYHLLNFDVYQLNSVMKRMGSHGFWTADWELNGRPKCISDSDSDLTPACNSP